MKYKINSKKEIIKTDFEERYNKEDFIRSVSQSETQLKQLEAQAEIYKAKVDNVARNHPHVLKVSEEDKNAIWLYHENFVASLQAEKMIKALKKGIKGVKQEMKEIEKQTGIKFYD